jgi:hypothetical protein
MAGLLVENIERAIAYFAQHPITVPLTQEVTLVQGHM